jgi:hypothetical protein
LTRAVEIQHKVTLTVLRYKWERLDVRGDSDLCIVGPQNRQSAVVDNDVVVIKVDDCEVAVLTVEKLIEYGIVVC